MVDPLKARIVIAGMVVVIVVVVIVFFIDKHGNVNNGIIEIGNAPPGTVVFLNNKLAAQSTKPDTPIVLSGLSIGTHVVVAAKDGYWPWSKELLLASGEKVRVSIFTVLQEPQREKIEESEARHSTYAELLDKYVKPSKESPLVSKDKVAELWLEDNALHVRWKQESTLPEYFCVAGSCNNELIVLPTDKEVRNVTFFPNRNDVALFSTENGIFAIEFDKRGTQNFQPLYLGSAPHFVVVEQQLLVVEDEGMLTLLHL